MDLTAVTSAIAEARNFAADAAGRLDAIQNPPSNRETAILQDITRDLIAAFSKLVDATDNFADVYAASAAAPAVTPAPADTTGTSAPA